VYLEIHSTLVGFDILGHTNLLSRENCLPDYGPITIFKKLDLNYRKSVLVKIVSRRHSKATVMTHLST